MLRVLHEKYPWMQTLLERVFYAVLQCRWRQQKVHFTKNVLSRYRQQSLQYMA